MVRPDAATAARLVEAGMTVPKKPVSVAALLRRPTVTWSLLRTVIDGMPSLSPVAAEQVETDLKYAGYLAREEARSARTRKMEAVVIPDDMDFNAPGISTEVGERLRSARPATLGAAARLPGVTPAAIDMLAVLLARRRAG